MFMEIVQKWEIVLVRPALVVDHPNRQVAGVDAQVEGDTPHHDQPQFQAWARNYHSNL